MENRKKTFTLEGRPALGSCLAVWVVCSYIFRAHSIKFRDHPFSSFILDNGNNIMGLYDRKCVGFLNTVKCVEFEVFTIVAMTLVPVQDWVYIYLGYHS